MTATEILKIQNIFKKNEYSCSNGNKKYFVIGKLSNMMSFKGYFYCDVMVDDLITGPFVEDNKMCELTKINKVILSNDIKIQKQRINYLVGNEYVEYFNKFEYGDYFWINVYNEYCKIEYNDFGKLNDYDNVICIVGDYIEKYEDLLLVKMTEELESRGIYGLKKNQKISLIKHPFFGININNWNEKYLYLLFEIEGIGIETIIKITNVLNASTDTKMKLNLIYKLDKELCIYFDEDLYDYLLSGPFLGYIKIDSNKFNQIITELSNDNIILQIKNYLYNKPLYNKEHNISDNLIKLKNKRNMIEFNELHEKLIFDFIDEEKLNINQSIAIKRIFNNSVSIIYGKAGTGKTTIIKSLINTINYLKIEFDIYFLAPTAIAKEKLKQSMHSVHNHEKDFMTIHSFNRQYEYNEIYTFFIIDETSMIDINVLNDFIEKIKYTNCSIIFLGDIRQLPSVGQGNVFNSLISSNSITKTELDSVIRNNSTITNILNDVCNGNNINKEIDKKIFLWKKPKSDNIDTKIEKIVNDRIESIQDNKTLIITPLNITITKYTNLIRDIVNPEGDEIIHKNKIFRLKDKVIHTKNFNKEGLYNGLIGTITKIEKNKIFVTFNNDKKFVYLTNEKFINYLDPAYIITVHKSQGQEYDEVIVIIDNSNQVLNRNLLYTALSRAKNKIVLISEKEFVNQAINKTIERLSLMKEMLMYYNSDIKKDFIDVLN